MKKKRYFAGGGVPTTGGMYNTAPVQYPFPSDGGGMGPPPSNTNTTVNVNGQEVTSETDDNPFGASEEAGPLNMRKGGRVKAKSHSKSKPKSKSSRGDGIAQRGRTRGRML